jgi:hypothetical protein
VEQDTPPQRREQREQYGEQIGVPVSGASGGGSIALTATATGVALPERGDPRVA